MIVEVPPKAGDRKKSDELGFDFTYHVWMTWTICPECNEGRWARTRSVGAICKPCNLRINVQPKGCAMRLKGKGYLQAGDKNHSWRGGRKQHVGGYVYALIDSSDPMFSMCKSLNNGYSGYVLEHRLVMAREIGRPLKDTETVHHRNGERQDNRIENLELWFGNHGNGQRVDDYHCPGCRCHEHEK